MYPKITEHSKTILLFRFLKQYISYKERINVVASKISNVTGFNFNTYCVNRGDLFIFESLGDLFFADRFCRFLGETELGLLLLEVARVVGLLGCFL